MNLSEKHLEEIRSETHADYMAEEANEKASLTGGRSLYKLWAGQRVMALITTYNKDRVLGRYQMNGGKAEITNIERISYGFPEDVCKVYA